jgi:hypothetical protein
VPVAVCLHVCVCCLLLFTLASVECCSTPVGEKLLKFNFRGGERSAMNKPSEEAWNGSFASRGSKNVRFTGAGGASTTKSRVGASVTEPTSGLPVRSSGTRTSVFRKGSVTSGSKQDEGVSDRLRKELPRFQSMALTIAETARMQEMRVKMQAAATAAASGASGKRATQAGQQIARMKEAVNKGVAISHKGSVAIDPSTGLPAHLSEEEAMRAQLIVGGRFDMAEMQRAAVEKARNDELLRQEKASGGGGGFCVAFSRVSSAHRNAVRKQRRARNCSGVKP